MHKNHDIRTMGVYARELHRSVDCCTLVQIVNSEFVPAASMYTAVGDRAVESSLFDWLLGMRNRTR